MREHSVGGTDVDTLYRDAVVVRHDADVQAHGDGDDVMHWNRLPQDNKKLYGRALWYIVLLLILLLGVHVLTTSAKSAPPEHGKTHPVMHEFYQKLTIPGTKRSCCSNQDCDKAVWRIGKTYEVYLYGKWREIPEERVLRIAAPDGEAHVCAQLIEPHEIYCFIAGDGS